LAIAAAAEGLRSASEEQVRMLQCPEGVAEGEVVKVCPACNNTYLDDSVYCRKCGLKRPQRGLLNNEWLIKFIKTPGEAPVHIMEAMARRKPLYFVKEEKTPTEPKMKFKQLKTSDLETFREDGIWTEPNVVEVREDFQQRLLDQTLDRAKLKGKDPQLDVLAGKNRSKWKSLDHQLKVFTGAYQFGDQDVDTFEFILPDVHKDPEVLLALSQTANLDVFGCATTQAMVKALWRQVRRYYAWELVVQAAVLVLFLLLTIMMNEGLASGMFENKEAQKAGIDTFAPIIFAFWIVSVMLEAKEAARYLFAGKFCIYCQSPYNMVDFLLMGSNGWLLAQLLTGNDYDNEEFRGLAASCSRGCRRGISRGGKPFEQSHRTYGQPFR